MTAAPQEPGNGAFARVLEDGWRRTHPVTVAIAGIQGVVGVAFALVAVMVTQVPNLRDVVPWWLVALPFVLMISMVAGGTYLGWRFTRYRIGSEAVELRSGVLFRKYRQARLDRLQAVDVVQPLVPRLFGFAELKVEVAGGEDSGVKLQYLRRERAEELRREVLDRASGRVVTEPIASPAAGATAPGATATEPAATAAVDEQEVYRVPVPRLIGSVFFSWPMVVALVSPIVLIAATLIGLRVIRINDDITLQDVYDIIRGGVADAGPDVLFSEFTWTTVPAIAAVAGLLWAQFQGGYDFRAALSPEGMRLAHGLTSRRRQTVPPGRVQAVRFTQSLIWRRFDWWRVTINVAGYQDDQEAVSTLLPVGPSRDALFALWLVMPELGDRDPDGTIAAAMRGRGGQGGFTANPKRTWIWDIWQWRRRAVLQTEQALFIREGFFVRVLTVIPHERIQSLALQQGPVQRLLRVADVQLHSTQGAIVPVAHHMDLADAIALLESQAEHSRQRRALPSKEQWLANVDEVLS